MEDLELIQRYWNRDEASVALTQQKYGNMCYHIAVSILGNKQDAEECVNDTYLRVWHSIPPEQPRNFKAFLCRIVRNLAIDGYRARQRHNAHYDFNVVLEELADCMPDREDSDGALAANLNTFLDGLEELDRNLFLGRYWHAYSVNRLASAYGMTANYVSVRLHRTREKLKQYLTERGYRI